MVLFGLQGVGKSATGNTILGRGEFQSDISSSALTLQTESRNGLVCGRSVMVVDTPSLFNRTLSDRDMKQEMEKALALCQPGPYAFLIIIQLGRFTEQERSVMDELTELLGMNVSQYSMVLFTYGDKLKNKTIDQFVKEDKNLMKLIDKCGQRYHVFNNSDTENKAQVSEFLEKIDTMIKRRKKYPWAKILCIVLPVALLAITMLYTNKQVPIESKPSSQLSSVKEVEVTVQPEDVLETSARFFQMLHGVDLNWKGLIPIGLGLVACWWILRRLRK